MKFALALSLLLASFSAHAGPPVLWGSPAKLLSSGVNFNDVASFLVGTADPTSSAQSAPQGSIYCRTGASGGACYAKQDAGSSTNWTAFSTGAGGTVAPTGGGTGLTTYTTGDMLYASATNTLSKRAAGNEGYIARMVGGVPTWQPQLDFRHVAMIYDDFLGPVTGINGTCGGASCKSNINGSASSAAHPGVWRLGTGTSTTGYGNMFASNQDDIVKLGGGATYYDTAVNLSALSDGTNTYEAICGLSRGPYLDALPSLDGLYLSADSNANPNWLFKSYAGSTPGTPIDTGVPITTGWVSLGWVLNSAGTSVQAYLSHAASGSPRTTGIPTAVLQFQCMIKKAAGTTNVFFDIDYLGLLIDLAVDR